MLSTYIDTTLHLSSCEAGMTNGGHMVIEGCSSSSCESCGKNICNMCAGILSKFNNGTVLCLDCYRQQLDDSIPSLDRINLLGPIKIQQEMWAQLRDSGWVVNKSMITNMETLDLYDSLVADKSVDRFARSANTVLFPLYPPSQT